jgi:hypothetical protein
MAKILVAGGLHQEENNQQRDEARAFFADALGREIVARQHVLLGGNSSGLDAKVAAGAKAQALQQNLDPRKFIRSWVTETIKPAHSIGEVTRSRMGDWGRVPKGFSFPEPIQQADAVIIVGGRDGTHYAASWARLANKPLVPVAAFGQAAAEIFNDEMSVFDRRYAARLSLDEYQILDRILADWLPETVKAFASDVVTLAERLITPTEVFLVMSFAEKANLIDAYNTFRRVCKENNFSAFKVDHHLDSQQRIIPAIFSSIRRAAFIIADLSESRPNVYYELGYANALGKEIITTAFKNTRLPFDVFDIPTIFWDSQDALEKKVRAEIIRIGQKFGRQPISFLGESV